jgi:hypothetical protein
MIGYISHLIFRLVYLYLKDKVLFEFDLKNLINL